MADILTERISYEQTLANLLDAYGVGAGSGTIVAERLTLINYVKAKLDEIIPEGEGVQFAVDGDVNISDPLNLIINAILDEAAKKVLLKAPGHVLDPVKSADTAGTADATDNKIGFIPLADNFVRFISLKMQEWKREVRDFITPQDKAYSIQKNKYTRGGIAKPVVAMTHRSVGGVQKRVIEYFSVDSSHNIEWLYYIQETSAQDIQTNLVDALTWVAAGIVLQITERADLAKTAFEQEILSYQNL